MDRVLNFLNNKWLVGALVALFLLGMARRVSGR